MFFTFAAGLELREATIRLGRWASNPSWWSAAIQFADTLLFNLNTFDAMQDGRSCFLVSGVLAYRAATGSESTMAAVNVAGCVLFGISAVASYIVPSTGTVLDLATPRTGAPRSERCASSSVPSCSCRANRQSSRRPNA